MMKLIILGPPGSGKGTVAERLEQDFSFFHISAGELLRKEAITNTLQGKKIKALIDAGHLVPDEFIHDLIQKKIGNKRKYILDGFPRSVEQARMIEDFQVNKALYLAVPEDLIVERLSGRRVCAQGHHGYHIKYLPPKKAGICDIDGSALIQRKDDLPAVIKERFKVFHEQTAPVADYYQKKKMLIIIDGSGSPDEVYRLGRKKLQLETTNTIK